MARAQDEPLHAADAGRCRWSRSIDDNIDVEVVLAGEAERWGTTVYTLANLDSLMRKWEQSGECGAGRYFWADPMLIVRRLDVDNLVEVIEALLDADEFSSAMERLGQDAQPFPEQDVPWVIGPTAQRVERYPAVAEFSTGAAISCSSWLNRLKAGAGAAADGNVTALGRKPNIGSVQCLR